MRYLITLLLLFCSSVFADTALIIHQNYNQVHSNVGGALTSAGHTVTYSTSEVTTNLSSYDQIWDLRYSSLSSTAASAYDTFVENGGFLYLVTENPGCCGGRNSAVATLISNMGGGSNLTIGGYTSNTISQVNTTYMTALASGTTITFAAGSAITNYGNGRWLLKDASGNVGGVIWIGNADDLDTGYTGTVITVSDINWIDGTYMTSVNETALEDIIDGIVASTVEGTISGSGTSSPTTTTTTGASTGPTSTQSTAKSAAGVRRDSYYDNGIYIDQVGDSNTISILQASGDNQLRGIDQQKAQMWGDNNTYDIRQGASTTVGINLIELMVDGNSNDITLHQDRYSDGTEDGSASGDHILRLFVDGNSNTVNTNQRSQANYDGHFAEINIIGNLNSVDLLQRSLINETAFIDITGNSNVVNLLQENLDTVGGNKFADIKLTGDGHTVNLEQSGTGAHSATIDLTNGSASSTLNLDQLGSTDQSYSIEQTCYTVGGCSATVTQGN
jgi:hypothetical protein